jgi:AcrR family transcriptional regulator
MPRHVDHAERRREITSAAVRILARGGPSALTLKSLAEELGGSITLVTHFFANRAEIFAAVVDDLSAGYDAELAELEGDADESRRLGILLEWMLPLTTDDIAVEAGRIALISHRGEHVSIDHFFDVMEDRMRGLLRSHLSGLVPAESVEGAVSMLRAVVNGLVLSAVEHPELWPAPSQLAVVESALSSLGLSLDAKTAVPA